MPEAQTIVGVESSSEQSQLLQTIEMFEIILQSQPNDFQSLEILKEAYSKLGRQEDVIRVARQVAQAYVQLGQLSSAILEYESILQSCPGDPEVLAALAEIEASATSLQALPPMEAEAGEERAPATAAASQSAVLEEVEDGRQAMFQLFVGTRLITPGDFDLCWPGLQQPPGKIVEPFIQALADRGTVPIERSLKLLCEKARLALLPLDRYDVDFDLTRSFPAETCRRWCVAPFDRMGRAVLVATCNPFNRQAAQELEARAKGRLLWYLSPPQDLLRALKKAFR